MRHRRRNSDQWMESDKKKGNESMGVLEAGAKRAAELGAGGKGPLRRRCCVVEVFLRNSIVFP